MDVPVRARRGRRVACGAAEVGERSRDEGVVHAVEIAPEIRIEDARDDQEAENGQDAVARACADILQRQALHEEGRGGQRGGGEGDKASLLRGEGEAGRRSEEKRPRAGFPFRAGIQVANACPKHHEEEAGEEHFLDEVGCEEGEEGGRAEQDGEHEAGDEALREALQGGDAEDEAEDGEYKRRAAQERAVERGGIGVASRLLDGRRRVVERGAMVVLGLVCVSPGLKQASRGERLVGLVWVECAVEDHVRFGSFGYLRLSNVKSGRPFMQSGSIFLASSMNELAAARSGSFDMMHLPAIFRQA